MSAIVRASALLLVLTAAGCASDPGPPLDDGGALPRRGLGESCTASEDCTSTLCVDVGGGDAVCTESCTRDADCPGAGWACVQPDHFDATICGCESAGREICDNHADDDCNGRIDDCRICGAVGVPEDDHENCGACGHACRADQECHAGTCRCTDATAMDCGGTCIDVSVSTQHCGSCTNVCSAEQLCSGGTCGCLAATSACGTLCVDTQSDDRHCGACGHACPSTQYCLTGTCTCPNGWRPCGGGCVDTQTSTADCGTCGHACRADQRCTAGACACGAGITDCGTACMDTRSDVANCGACGHACESGETCNGSACHCATGLHCGGACIASTDAMNCGACGNVCPAAEICTASSCRCPIAGNTFCATSARCTNLLTDSGNCGTCDHVCDPATTCSTGACVCPTLGQTFCAGAGCVPFATDPMHCGSCTTACAPNQICSSSRCSCPASLPNLCPTVGCVAEATDPMNCGACGNVCRNGETCSSYACRCPLTSQRWCAAQGTCIDVQSDPMNCGSCGNVCPSDATCSTGICRCNTAGLTVCGTSCVDTTTDRTHCGSCTRVCTGSQVCSGSACTCSPPTTRMETRLTNAANDSWLTAIAWNGTNALLAWIDRRSTTGTVYTMLLAPDGTPAGMEQTLTGVMGGWGGVDVTWNGAEFAVVAMAGSSGTLFRLNPDGTVAPGTSSFTASSSLGSGEVRVGYTTMLGYYAFVSTTTYFDFIVLGAVGSMPRPAIHVTSGAAAYDVAASPSGQIGALVEDGAGRLLLQIINADGSITSSSIMVPVTVGYSTVEATLVHDGTTWIGAWRQYNFSTNAIVVARGASLGASVTAVSNSGSATANTMRRPQLAMGTGEVVLTWQARATSTDTVWRIDGERFLVPASATAAVSALEAGRVYMPTTSVYSQAHANVITSAGLILGWADTRWGATEVYDTRVTLPLCAP